MDAQQNLDFDRAAQRALLRNCALPREAKDKYGHSVSPITMGAVLNAIYAHYPRAFPSVETIGDVAKMRPRTVSRAIEVLQAMGLIIVTPHRTPRGHRQNQYTIVWSELALLASDKGLPLYRQPGPAAAPTAPGESHLPQGQTQLPLANGHLPHGQNPTAPRGMITSDVEVLNKEEIKAPSDVAGARVFFEEDESEIREKADELGTWLRCKDEADFEFVLKVATLWYDTRLSEDAVQQLLESFRLKSRDISNRFQWAWQVLRNQCQKAGGPTFEQLLATTEFPRELLAARR